MKSAPYRVHRLIQDLNQDQHLARAFAQDPEPLFTRYELSDTERALLRDGSSRALLTLGVHPNLQMKFQRLKAPAPTSGPSPLDSYLRDLGLKV